MLRLPKEKIHENLKLDILLLKNLEKIGKKTHGTRSLPWEASNWRRMYFPATAALLVI